MRQIVVFVILMVLFSCQSKEEKYINAEFSKIQQTWSIDAYSLSGSGVSDALLKKFKFGEMLLKSCKYTDKDFAVQGRACGGDFDMNGYVYGISYTYDYGTSKYVIFLSGSVGKRDETVVDLMYGEWTLEVIDNKLYAKQSKAYNTSNVLVSFTATRK